MKTQILPIPIDIDKLEIESLTYISKFFSITSIVKYIIELDDIWRGSSSFINRADLPVAYITSNIKKVNRINNKNLQKSLLNTLISNSTFIKTGAVNFNGEKWSPFNETLRSFVLKNEKQNSRIIYIELEEQELESLLKLINTKIWTLN